MLVTMTRPGLFTVLDRNRPLLAMFALLFCSVGTRSLWAETPLQPSFEPPTMIGPGPSVQAPGPLPITPSTPVEPLAPQARPVIEGIDFDGNAANTSGRLFIPADPMGAVGPGHLVSLVNASIQWHTRSGVLQHSQGLGLGVSGSAVDSFFQPLNPANALFDPKVVFDPHAGRFLVVALEKTATGSRILLAVSIGSDPNGGWFFHAIDAKELVNGSDHWADFPGLAVDEEVVYVTANLFSLSNNGFGGERLWIIGKGLGSGGFYDGGPASVARYDPYGAVGQPGFAMTTQPAQVFGPAGVPGVGNPGTFLVSYSGITNGVSESLQILRVDDPLGANGGPFFS